MIDRVERIAIFRALHLGDLLLAVPALRSIRTGFPHAEITLIGLPWAASFARRFSHYIDRFVEFTGYPGIAEVEFDLVRTQRFLAQQRAYGYDLVIQMHGSGCTSDRFALELEGRRTAGYYEKTPPAGLTFGMPYPEHLPEVLRNLRLAELLGCCNLDPSIRYSGHLERGITVVNGMQKRPRIAGYDIFKRKSGFSYRCRKWSRRGHRSRLCPGWLQRGLH